MLEESLQVMVDYSEDCSLFIDFQEGFAWLSFELHALTLGTWINVPYSFVLHGLNFGSLVEYTKSNFQLFLSSYIDLGASPYGLSFNPGALI